MVERRLGDHPDAVGGGVDDDRHQPDPEAADRQPQRARLRRPRCPASTRPAGSRDSTVNGLPQSAINITIDGISAQDNHLKTGDGFFARVSPRLDAIEEVTVSTAAQDAAEHRPGRGADPVRHALGQQRLHGQRLLLPAALQAERQHLVQQPRRRRRRHEDDACYQPGARVGGPIMIPGCGTAATRRSSSSTTRSRARPGQNTENRTHPAPARRAGHLPLHRRRPDARGQPARARGARTDIVVDDRSDDRPAARRHPQPSTAGSTVVDLTDPLHQQFTLPVPDRQRHASTRPAASTSTSPTSTGCPGR